MARDAVKQVSAKATHPVTATTETHEASSFVISTVDRKLTAFVNGKERFVVPVQDSNAGKAVRHSCVHVDGTGFRPRHLKWLAVGLPAGTNAVALSALLATGRL